ncbi:MAG: GNAT family N-acetyltransferase [Prolixibacteraceae bacterium]|nr:GNAT family N-acetyltransferase [Prolixibacteraceae bacterium]
MKLSSHFRRFPVIKIDTLVLRKLSQHDANDLFLYYSHPDVYRFLDWNGPKDIKDAKRIIKIWNKNYKLGRIMRLGIEDIQTKKLIGTIFLSDFDGYRADIGYELDKNYWNKGIMNKVIYEIKRIGFEILKLRRIQATVDENNIMSIKVLEKNGFKYEGKLKNYETNHVSKTVKDMLMYAIVK